MSGALQLDGRRAKALEAELLRRAQAVLSGDGRNPQVGPVEHALFGVAARIGEEVTRRLDRAPAKQADNFYTAAGIGRDPARPATVPVAFKLVDGVAQVLSAPPHVQLMTDAGGPLVFETETRIDLAPGTIAALRGIDAQGDAIAIPSAAVMAAKLPRAEPLRRRLRSGAAAGATKLQIDPAAGLAPGMLLRIGEGEAARHYQAIAVEGDLVTIEPPLETGLPENAPVLEVDDFAPFAAITRNHQAHAFYLGHASLLDIPSAVTITISGAPLPAEATWSWWGQLGDDDPPAWQLLGPGTKFTKLPGKLVKKKIGTHESLWLRAELPGKSTASAEVRDVRIGIGAGGVCDKPHQTRCAAADRMNVGFEAVANNAPVVTNRPFHPFGREPRLYDGFYIGSAEAFSKVGAEISLCFKLAGPDLGPLAGIDEAGATRLFAVGSDGLLYRAQTPNVTGGTTQGGGELRPVPPPSDQTGITFLQEQSPVAFWKQGATEYVAAASAAGGAIYVAEMQDTADLALAKWFRLPLPVTAKVDALAVHSGGSAAVLYALVGTDLFVWNNVANGASPGPIRQAQALIQVEPSDPVTGAGAVLIVEQVGSLLQLTREGAGPGSSPITSSMLPSGMLRAFDDPFFPNAHYLAGYDQIPIGPNIGKWELQLIEVSSTLVPGARMPTGLVVDQPLPVAFSPGRLMVLGFSTFERRPMLSVATKNPAHVTWYKDATSLAIAPAVSREPISIGVSANTRRGFFRSANHVAVQRPDLGLFFRASAGARIARDIRVACQPGYLVGAANIPASSGYFVYFRPTGRGIEFNILGSPVGSNLRVLQLTNPGDPPPIVGADDIVAYDSTFLLSGIEQIVPTPPPNTIELPATGPLGPFIVTILAVPSVGAIWRFGPSNTDNWADTNGLAGTATPFDVLSEIGRESNWQEAALVPSGSPVALALTAGEQVWRVGNDDFSGADLLDYGTGDAFAYPHAYITAEGHALFLAAPASWQVLGPDSVPNPALSWEYWNGESWWALPTSGAGQLHDLTNNFMQSGGVFFKVPADIQPTQVAGRKNHWLRAHLIGGDYGEAKVTVTSTTISTSPLVTDQVVTRDVDAIRAPYVIGLKLGYCAQELVRPEIVLAQDSLGTIDQTSANEAGLEFSVFTPVGELMNPKNPADTAAAAAADAALCDDPCPPPADAQGSPCDAPGAYDSCDSPCVAPEGYRRAAAGEPQGFVRGLMLGFAQGFAGDTISLYVDAAPGGPPVELAAEMLRDGRFVPINVAGDTSYGLTEPGILTLAMPAVPDRSDLFGAAAHWLRLRPKTDAASWSPRLHAIHLNAVLARSAETRTMERLGASTGLEGQTFHFSEAPVEPGSLVLRISEKLAEEDDPDGRLDVKPLSLPGQWVRWEVSDDLIEAEEPARAFMLDAEQGIVTFGDGRGGRIPPLGAEVVAEIYARVVGDRANGVPPGKQLQLLAPLAGVERATALDFAAGGSDAEALESARRRAAAKVRHGRRILTRADLEDHALTLAPGIAQVRAESRGGGMRLVVVMKGAEARPSPAALRGFAAAIREVAGFGIARPGGLTVVGPRLLPLAIELVLQPRSPDLFAEAAEQAKDRLTALLDPATGNHDGKGWPLGRVPDAQDVAAALAPIDALALPVAVTLLRGDKEAAAEKALPRTLPSDVLVRLDPAAIAFERSREAAA